ncbi:porin [Paeniroseomonas aquatica]|uniref:Porin n=2 Tax=Paeniroseomonas aquatica TaxID=373043 RepID=A0ABT8A3T3_9PROT|nr:porin [Paeniroseomonas aquatica]MDN3564333.1 porin [Paeniroseomonas aquatica]
MPASSWAQEAPSVRIGGFFRAYYGNTQQSGRNSTVPSTLATGVGSATGNLPANGANIARLSKNDFSTDAEVRVLVNGKTANGLNYGAVVEIAFNQQEGRNIVQQRASTGKSTASIDEAYAFVSSPRLGQIRFGDEDGPVGGLMNSGVVTNFGSGGIYGDRESFVTRQANARTMTSPGALGDSTKIIYLSPQVFGFDFGASYAANYNEGEDTGCSTNQSSGWCDSAYAFTGASAIGIPAAGGGFAARRNEYQAALRWRGSLAGVGLAVTGGYLGAGAARELTLAGTQARVFNNLNVFQVGAQATAYGVTVGAQYEHGDSNYFWGNTLRGDRPMDQFFTGASYTAGPFSFGANYVIGTFEGASRGSFSAAQADASGGRSNFAANPAGAAIMRRIGYGIGGNYRLAPGLDLLAEYSSYTIAERGRDFDPSNAGVQDRSTTKVFLVGTRLAF